MKVSNKAANKLKKVFTGSDTMWKININSINFSLNLESVNYQKDLFKKIVSSTFRLVDAEGKPWIYGSASDKSSQPLKSLRDLYPNLLYIEFPEGKGWKRYD